MKKVLLVSARSPEAWPGPSGIPLRVRRRAFGLHLLAENVRAPVMLLEAPTREALAQTLQRERVQVVGVSFGAHDLAEARDLARLVRLVQPHAHIMLGGAGAGHPGVSRLVDCDQVVTGDGLRALRAKLKEDVDAPVRLPTLVAATRSSSSGRTRLGLALLGSPPYFAEPQALLNELCRLSEALQTRCFLAADEALFANAAMLRGLAAAMERQGRAFEFAGFARSADLAQYAPEELVRLGLYAVFLAPEEWTAEHARQVASLRAHGVAVFAPTLLPSQGADALAEAALALEADAVDFLPALELDEDGLPRDSGAQAFAGVARAKELAKVRQGSPLARIAATNLERYRTYEFSDDEWLRQRAQQARVRAEDLRLLLDLFPGKAPPAQSPNLDRLKRDFAVLLEPQTLAKRAMALGAQALDELSGAVHRVRRAVDLTGTFARHYRWTAKDSRAATLVRRLRRGLPGG